MQATSRVARKTVYDKWHVRLGCVNGSRSVRPILVLLAHIESVCPCPVSEYYIISNSIQFASASYDIIRADE